jgi:MFS family permease
MLRAAITVVFFANGALFASWASRIPALADRTDATTGALGLALLAPAVGAVATMPQIGRLLPGRSSRTFCRWSMLGLMGAVVLPGFAPTIALLAVALLFVGVSNSALDVAMNAQGVSIERHQRRPILSSLHAAFSFGGFAGAGVGALAAALHVSPAPHLIFAALLFGIPGLLAVQPLLRDDEDPDAGVGRLPLRRLPGRLAVLGVAAFFCLLAEGAASDWSAALVSGPLGGTPALGAIAYAIFSIGMGVGRLLADGLWRRWGASGLLRRSGALAASGFTVALIIGTAPVALAGFAALGLGLSGVVPTLFRSAANHPGVPTGPALAAVSSLGYLGFLAGPPLIGGLAEVTSLHLAVGLLAVAAALVVVLAPVADPPPVTPAAAGGDAARAPRAARPRS